MEQLKEWAAIITILVSALISIVVSFVLVRTNGSQNTRDIESFKTRFAVMDDEISNIKMHNAANDARREEMYKMQEETRQDVKKILVSITELATKMASNKEAN